MRSKIILMVVVACIVLGALISVAWGQSSAEGDHSDSEPVSFFTWQVGISEPLTATQITTVTMFAYDDVNKNGWRDPKETPYLPSFIGDIYCYSFRSYECDYSSGTYQCLAQGYTNQKALPRDCPFSVRRLRPFGIFDEEFGGFITVSETMTIYFPFGSKPNNLLGTPTPTVTPTPTPTETPTPTPTITPTPRNMYLPLIER